MANVSHASLTGSNLHEPKGIGTASSGDVYIADGAGSGGWTTAAGTTTGQIADFCTPIAPTGWLECNGADVSTTTYSALYAAMTIQQTGSRINGLAVITSLSSTTNMKAGYYVFGTGIASGTTIVTVDSASQITISANASSTGSATVIVSPWLTNTGTIRLPDFYTAGRYRRSRTSTVQVGTAQAGLIANHTHPVSGTTASDGSHTHSVNDPGHTHGVRFNQNNANSYISNAFTYTSNLANSGSQGGVSDAGFTGISLAADGAHTHTFSVTSSNNSSGGTETRPISVVVMTCVKT